MFRVPLLREVREPNEQVRVKKTETEGFKNGFEACVVFI